MSSWFLLNCFWFCVWHAPLNSSVLILFLFFVLFLFLRLLDFVYLILLILLLFYSSCEYALNKSNFQDSISLKLINFWPSRNQFVKLQIAIRAPKGPISLVNAYSLLELIRELKDLKSKELVNRIDHESYILVNLIDA